MLLENRRQRFEKKNDIVRKDRHAERLNDNRETVNIDMIDIEHGQRAKTTDVFVKCHRCLVSIHRRYTTFLVVFSKIICLTILYV